MGDGARPTGYKGGGMGRCSYGDYADEMRK